MRYICCSIYIYIYIYIYRKREREREREIQEKNEHSRHSKNFINARFVYLIKYVVDDNQRTNITKLVSQLCY